MSTVGRIAKNTVVMFFGEIVGKVLALIFVIYVARYLQAEGFGILSFALAFTGMFNIFSDIGFYELIVREVARNKKLADKYVGSVATLKAIIVTIMFGSMCLAINAMGYPFQIIKIVYIIGLSIVFDAYTMVSNAIFQAFEKMEYISIGKILKNTLLLVGALLIISNGYGLIAFACLYLLTSLVVLIYSLSVMVCYFTKPKLKIDVNFWRWLLKEGVPFWASSVFVAIYHNIDKVMLSMMVGNEAVGFYSAAYKLIASMNFIPIAFIGSVFPVTSRLYLSSKDSLKFAFERSFKYMLILGTLLGVLTVTLAEKIITSIYGEGYLPSIAILQILIWAEVFLFMNVALGNLLRSINRQIIITYLTAFGCLLNVIMNLLLIPSYGCLGASFATVMTRFFVFLLLSTWVIRSGYRLSDEVLASALKVFVTISLAITIYYLFDFNSYLFAASFVMIFLTMLYFLKIIDDVDKKLIKNVVLSFRIIKED